MVLGRKTSFLFVAASLAASILPSQADAEIVVGAGRSVSLMTLSSIDQGCHWLGPVTISIIEPPRGGVIAVSQTRTYPNFNALNTRSRCNTLKLPATRVTYQSSGAYLGFDYVTIEAVFPGGGAKRIRVPVSVRPIMGYVPEANAGDDAGPPARTPRHAGARVRHALHETGRLKAHAPAEGIGKARSQPTPLLTPI